jgi:DNA-binding response OmpR family regulator
MNQQPRILVVDDESQIARVLRTGLKTHGYDVRVASDGVSALETFNDWRRDCASRPDFKRLDAQGQRLRAGAQFPAQVRGERRHPGE